MTAEQTAALAALVSSSIVLNVPLGSNGTATDTHANELFARGYADGSAQLSRHICENLPGYTGGNVTLRILMSLPNSGTAGQAVHLDVNYGWLEEAPLTEFAAIAYDYTDTIEPNLEGLLYDRIHVLELTILEARVSDTAKFMGLRITRNALHASDNYAASFYIHKLELVYTGVNIAMRPVAP